MDSDSGVSFCTFTATLLFSVRDMRDERMEGIKKKRYVFFLDTLYIYIYRREKIDGTERNNYTGLSIDRLVNVAAYTGTYAISEKVTFPRILYAVQSLHGGSSSIVKILFPVLSSSPLFSHPSVSVSVIAHFRLVSRLRLKHRAKKRIARSRNTRLNNSMKTRGRGKRVLSLFSLFSFFLQQQQQRERTIARSKTYREGWKRFYCGELEKERKKEKRKKARKEEKREKRKGEEKKNKI